MTWFPDGPRLSEVGRIDNLSPHRRTDYVDKKRPYKKNVYYRCDCKEFVLGDNKSTGTKINEQVHYCTCKHVRKWHVNSIGECRKEWIEKNEN